MPQVLADHDEHEWACDEGDGQRNADRFPLHSVEDRKSYRERERRHRIQENVGAARAGEIDGVDEAPECRQEILRRMQRRSESRHV